MLPVQTLTVFFFTKALNEAFAYVSPTKVLPKVLPPVAQTLVEKTIETLSKGVHKGPFQ